MFAPSSRIAKTALLGASALVFALGAGCKRPSPDAQPAASARPPAAVSAPPAEPVSHCRQLPGWGLTLDVDRSAAEKHDESAEDEDGDNDELLPFGVELGEAVPTVDGFAVAGVRGAGEIFVALLGQQASRRVDLGVVHGDAEPPALAAAADRVLVALRSSDAAGFTVRLGSLSTAGGEVAWGYELSKLGKSITGVEIAVGGAYGVLVLQSENKQHEPYLLLGSFALAALKEPFELKPLDFKDAEMPRLVERPGGYWLTWVRSLPEAKKPATAAGGGTSAPDPEERELVDVGLRAVEVAKLDERGRLVGGALRIGEPRRQMLMYDVAALSSGGLLVAVRSDTTAPGAEGGAILLSEVGPDGSVRTEPLQDEEMGDGAPTLLVDRDSQRPGPWLTVSAPNDASRLGLVQGSKTQLRMDPALGRAQMVAVSAGHFLAQRGRGRGVALESFDCAWPALQEAEKK